MRLTQQLRSLEFHQRQLVAAMMQLGGEPAVQQLKQVVAFHLDAKKQARALDLANAAAAHENPSFQQAHLAHQILHNPQFQIRKEETPFEKAIATVAKVLPPSSPPLPYPILSPLGPLLIV
jgi:hypothetical protein